MGEDTRGENEGKPVLETALRPHEWNYLCRFLQMDLAAVLKMTNLELLRAVDLTIERRGRRGLWVQTLRPKLLESGSN